MSAIPYIEDCVRLCDGSARDGLLLHKILKLYPTARLQRRGDPRRWIVKSAEEWGRITGLRPQQIHRAWASLAKRGLIVKERHELFAREGGKRVLTWVTPSGSALPGASKSMSHGEAAIDTPGISKSMSPIDSTSSHSSNNQQYKSSPTDGEDDLGALFEKYQEKQQKAESDSFGLSLDMLD